MILQSCEQDHLHPPPRPPIERPPAAGLMPACRAGHLNRFTSPRLGDGFVVARLGQDMQGCLTLTKVASHRSVTCFEHVFHHFRQIRQKRLPERIMAKGPICQQDTKVISAVRVGSRFAKSLDQDRKRLLCCFVKRRSTMLSLEVHRGTLPIFGITTYLSVSK